MTMQQTLLIRTAFDAVWNARENLRELAESQPGASLLQPVVGQLSEVATLLRNMEVAR